MIYIYILLKVNLILLRDYILSCPPSTLYMYIYYIYLKVIYICIMPINYLIIIKIIIRPTHNTDPASWS